MNQSGRSRTGSINWRAYKNECTNMEIKKLVIQWPLSPKKEIRSTTFL